MRQHLLAPSLWFAAAEHQEQRRASDPWEDVLEPFLDEDVVPVATIWDKLGVQACSQDNRHADRVAQIMQRNGFVAKKAIRIDGKSIRAWLRATAAMTEETGG